MIELEMAWGLLKALGIVVLAFGAVCGVVWCAVGTSEFLDQHQERKDRNQ